MRKIIFALSIYCIAFRALAGDAAWLESVPPARDLAYRDNKLLLLDFTGSDWCGWCKKLDAETFSTPAFADYASKNLVLVKIDFPRQVPQSEALKEANKALKELYEVKGFPTLVALKPDGSVVWKQTGYLAGGPAALIEKLNQFRPKGGTLELAPATAAAPTQWPAPPARNPGDEPRLQGILYSTSRSSAVLDGKSCREGDTVNGMRVVKIDRTKVTVEWNGKTEELKMN